MYKLIIFMYLHANAIAAAAAIDTSTVSSTLSSTVSSTMTTTTTTTTTKTMEDKTIESIIYIVVIVICLPCVYFLVQAFISCCKNIDNRYSEKEEILMLKRKKEAPPEIDILTENDERAMRAAIYNEELDRLRALSLHTLNPLVRNAQVETEEFTCVVISKVPTPYYDNKDSIC